MLSTELVPEFYPTDQSADGILNIAVAKLEKTNTNPTSILKQQNKTQRSLEDANSLRNTLGTTANVKYSNDTLADNRRRSNTARHFTMSHNNKIISSTMEIVPDPNFTERNVANTLTQNSRVSSKNQRRRTKLPKHSALDLSSIALDSAHDIRSN